MAESQTVAGYVANPNRSLERRPLRAEGHVLIGEPDAQGIPAWPIAPSLRQIVRRTRGGGVSIDPYVVVSALRLGHPLLPGRDAFEPSEYEVSLAMGEQVARATTSKHPNSSVETAARAVWVAAILSIVLLAMILLSMAPGAIERVVSLF